MRLGLGLFALALCAIWPLAAGAAVFTFDTPGEVVISATQAPNVWYTDRYAPAIFASGQVGGGRTGVLLENISSADSAANRPAAFSSPFYNTQGRKYDLAPGATGQVIDLFVSQSWDALTQIDGRLASFWATGFDAASTASGYFPIIEFNNNRAGGAGDGFRVWDSNTGSWFNVAGFGGYDQWYQLGLLLEGGQEKFFVNGNLVGVVNDPLTTQLGNVILQGYNSGNSYNIAWDSLSPVPEPAMLPLFGSMLIGLGCVALRRVKSRSS